MLSDAPATPPTIELSFEAPGPQRRWTVGLRWILAIPHLVWLYILVVVASVAVAVGWLVALFTGRMPLGIAEFVAKVLQYATTVLAYSQFLLSDRYPSFSLESADYPVELMVPPPNRLNRASVLFRFVLMVPGSIISTLLMAGAAPVLVVAWLITLITGQMPRPLFESLAAVLRYVARYYAFAAMLTSDQPKKLFGDGPTPVPASPPSVPTAAYAPAAGTAVATPPLTPPDPGTRPRITRLVLSKAGKRLVALFIVLGALSYAGIAAVSAIASDQFESAQDEFIRIENDAADDSTAYGRDIQSCALAGGLPCLKEANGRLADAIGDFRHELREIDFPQNALVAAHDLDEATARFENALRALEAAPDEGTYQARFAEAQAAGSDVSGAELALARALKIRLG